MCRKLALAATLLAIAAASPAIAETKAKGDAKPAAGPQTITRATPEQRIQVERMDALTRATFWARETAADPKDVDAGLKLSAALRAMGRFEEAVGAAERLITLDPSNAAALLEKARAFIGAGQGFYAIEAARKVQTLNPRDWRAPSLLGVAYEQVSRLDEAKASYELALSLSPNNPSVLTNLALFHAGKGDAAQAETLLRSAATQPAATLQVRQNLALVLGMQGKLAEAEKMLREDLPPAAAENNLAYLRAALGQANPVRSWESLRSGG